jgi:beta-N-acetylhexosaminidase
MKRRSRGRKEVSQLNRLVRIVWCLALVTLLPPVVAPGLSKAHTPALQPSSPADDEAWLEETMARMTTADKVGQLFLITFPGSEVGAGSDIARLVQILRVGGVILSPSNENFGNGAFAPSQVLALTTGLQELAFKPSFPVTLTLSVPVTVTVPLGATPSPSDREAITTTTTVTYTEVLTRPPQGIPLLMAVSQEGDGYPNTWLRGGFTSLPSNMAVGATWNDKLAAEFGTLVGRELEAVGINLLLGPSLDILSDPRPGQSGDLGTRVFGGDPYWVGRLGQVYISGVHQGSNWRVATVGKHLPGLGASDRSLEDEIATVDKSLQDLRLIELPPFFAVTQTSTITDTTDALMTAHIRYRGFQGSIRYVTQPISLNAQGLQEILAQPELVPWRAAGGVLVSDSLGVPAVRRHYSPDLESFPHRQIALDAFLAGNDLLTLSRFALNDSWEDHIRNVTDTILFFQSRYEEDDTFRARVDQSVRRILTLKHRICPEFSLESCTSNTESLSMVGKASGPVAQIAQSAVTLLYPAADELVVRLPRPPRQDEHILIFTDSREARECDRCLPFYLLKPQALEETILRLYGPQATGQVDPERIRSYTFAELHAFLQYGSPDLAATIAEADWIVFAMLDYAPDAYPSSTALKEFLREWTIGQATQNIIVMAHEAPYYLDTTEVSKLTAYYGLYGKEQPFVDASARVLFQEYAPAGESPVTVDGVGYDLGRQLLPDPDQVISVLWVDLPPEVEGTPEPVKLEVGDPLRIRTSLIRDHNGNPVPDGTPVTFHYVYVDEGLGGQVEAVAINGIAESALTLEHAGILEIRATSDPAQNSLPLQVVNQGETTEILTPTPTPTPTFTPTATSTPTSTPTPTPTMTPTATPSPTIEPVVEPPPPPAPRVKWSDLIWALVGTVAAGGVVVVVGRGAHVTARVVTPLSRAVLLSGACALAGYIYYGLGLPGSLFIDGITPGLRGLFVAFACGLVPLLIVFLVGRLGQMWRDRL